MKQYEYYHFKLSGKVLKKEVINTSPLAFIGFGLEKVVILNAGDLSDTSFACFYDMVGEKSYPLHFYYDSNLKTLTI